MKHTSELHKPKYNHQYTFSVTLFDTFLQLQANMRTRYYIPDG